jgi:hypothetical protein
MKPLIVVLTGMALVGCHGISAGETIASAPDTVIKQVTPRTRDTALPTSSIILDDLIGFVDGRTCEPNPATRELMDHLLVSKIDPDDLTLGNVIAPERFRPALGKPRLRKGENGFREVTLPVSGSWHGLTMKEVSSSGAAFSDDGFWSYRFHEPFERVRSILNAMGFAFDRKGNQPYDPLEAHVYASLFVIDGMTALDCEPRGTPPTEAESARKATEMPSHH